MNKTAYFFQGDVLLLPDNFPDSQFDRGVPLELARDFNNPDIFEIPAPDSSLIRVVSVLPGTELPKGWKSIPVRQILTMLSDWFSGSQDQTDNCTGRILRACHIAQWRRESVFCGRCGALCTATSGADEIIKNSMTYNESNPRRIPREGFSLSSASAAEMNTALNIVDGVYRICPKCGRMEFPRICPAIIVIITDDENRILLAHNKKFRAGLYSLIAGFNEAGESLEATVAREVREETNIEIKDITYVISQPWPFPNSLMLGFKARYSSGTLKPDNVEIEDAGWFTRDNLPDLPAEGALSRFLINRWLNSTL